MTRLVSFHAPEISLREALDGIAAAARVRLSYSGEALPLDRWVCASFDSVAIGDALTELLRGASVRLVVIAADHVVLAPTLATTPAPPGPRTVVLDRIVVTGSATGAARRPLAVALDILDGRDLAARSTGTLSQAFGAIPGLWMWEQSPASLVAQYGSIRGAASFGMSYPKVYIDGIQVANPLLLTRITPDAIDRIEVIRGPQGAALYGADAISGVANIITRHEPAGGDAAHARLQSNLGLAASDFAADPTVRQDHTLGLRTGSNVRSAGLNLELGTVGGFIPGAYARTVTATGAARSVGSRSILTGTLRLFGERAGTSISPLLAGVQRATPGPGGVTTAQTQAETEYTLGASGRFMQNDRWQHSVVLGVDGYSLSGIPDFRSPIPSADASALQAAQGAAARGTLRASSVAHARLGSASSADLTLAAEQSVLRQRTDQEIYRVPRGTMMGPTSGTGTLESTVTWRRNTGLIGQMNGTLARRVYLAGGVRVERDDAGQGSQWASLPMLGLAVVGDRGASTVKLRAAYGRGIRWPETTARATFEQEFRFRIPQAAPLSPEEQAGVEGGLDVILGQVLTFSVTRFDQTASGLIQRVTINGDSAGVTGGTGNLGMSGPGTHIMYDLQNVGDVTNRGWELEGAARHGPVSLTATYSVVDSRVRSLNPRYTGDLRPGDRMLEVPARTLSLSLGWLAARWSGSLTAYRAEDWVNYDRLALAEAFAGTAHQTRDFVGPMLRAYWKTYPGVTHLRAAGSVRVRPTLALTLTGDNLLNRQTGEPDNVTVLPGRTISLGLQWEF